MEGRGFWGETPPVAVETTPQQLGEYNLRQCLGRGALGEVWLADHQLLKRPCTIKLLSEDLVTQHDFIQRFEEEVGRLGQLSHPHLARLQHIVQADGRFGLVSDAVLDAEEKNLTLAAWLAKQGHPLPEKQIFEILLQAAQALDELHKHTVHGGLKPNNILIRGLAPLDVVLTDAGIARMVGCGAHLKRTFQAALPGLSQQLDQTHHSYLQTWAFMAPEQKWGRSDELSPAVDIFSFGLLAHYLLFGYILEGVPDFSPLQDCSYKWELLLRECLQRDSDRRPCNLTDLLRQIQAKEAGSCAESPQPIIKSSQLTRPTVDLHPEVSFKVDPTVRLYQAEEKEVEEVQPLPTEMVVIPAGRYERGSLDGQRDEMPLHQIQLQSYAIDVHPVTNEQFVRFLLVMGGEKDLYHRDLIRLRESRIKRSGGKLSIESGYHRHPVVGVTWYGASAYAKWVGKRLPTEAEWEIAASGAGERLRYPTGDTIDKSQSNYFSADTSPIGSYPAHHGLYDMAGNVYEWCQDWYDYNFYEKSVQEPDNPKGPVQGVYRVLRGGCWRSLKDDLRCSRRHRNNPGTVNGTYGFRCAADVR